LKVEFVKNGIIHPNEWTDDMVKEINNFGGVTDENLNVIELSKPKHEQGDGDFPISEWYIGPNPNNNFNNIEYINEDIVYIGPIKKSISHFYLETFCRCWFFLNEGNLNYKIAYTVQKGEEPKWNLVYEFLEGIGIKRENLIEIKNPTKFKTVIVPEQACELQKSYHPLYKALFDKLKEGVEPLSYKKVYFSKKYVGKVWFNRSLNYYLLDKIFKNKGYKIMYPEKMSIKETIAALKGCEEFAAQSGSNAHNALFVSDNSKVIVFNRSAHVHPHQTMIDKMRNLNTTYIDIFYPNLPVSWDLGPFGLFLTPQLEEYFKKYDFKYNAKKLKKNYYKNLQRMVNSWVLAYKSDYFNQYLDYFNFSARDLFLLLSDINKLFVKEDIDKKLGFWARQKRSIKKRIINIKERLFE